VRNLQRRLKKLEAFLTDPTGFTPGSPAWLEYWDKQLYSYIAGRDENALRASTGDVIQAWINGMDDPRFLCASIPGTGICMKRNDN
jgi:hypothetical protein